MPCHANPSHAGATLSIKRLVIQNTGVPQGASLVQLLLPSFVSLGPGAALWMDNGGAPHTHDGAMRARACSRHTHHGGVRRCRPSAQPASAAGPSPWWPPPPTRPPASHQPDPPSLPPTPRPPPPAGSSLSLPAPEAAAVLSAAVMAPDVLSVVAEWKYMVYSVSVARLRRFEPEQRGVGRSCLCSWVGARAGRWVSGCAGGGAAGRLTRCSLPPPPKQPPPTLPPHPPAPCPHPRAPSGSTPDQDNATWVHVNWFASGGVMVQSHGIGITAGPLGPSLSSDSFAWEVTNSTVVDLLVKYATIETHKPYLFYLARNVTLWPRADWPAGGLVIRRPMYIISWSDQAVSIDFGNCAGCASLSGRWSNITFDSVTLEGLGFGEPGLPATEEYSLVSAANFWFFNATRCV